MTILIACLGTDQRTHEYMQRLAEGESWEAIFLIADNDGKNTFKCGREVSFIIADSKQPLQQLASQIKESLKEKIADMEVAVNITLGTGKEHMALMSALIKLGLGIRLVAYTTEGIKEI